MIKPFKISAATITVSVLFFLFVFPISLPILDDRGLACAKEGGINDLTHKLPAIQTEGSHVVFGDGQSGRVPPQSKHGSDNDDKHIVFGDGEHGVLVELCEPIDTR